MLEKYLLSSRKCPKWKQARYGVLADGGVRHANLTATPTRHFSGLPDSDGRRLAEAEAAAKFERIPTQVGMEIS